MEVYNQVNEILVQLFYSSNKIEERFLTTGEFKDLTVNDMHVIHAIGMNRQQNMSSLAKVVGVTVGTLTIGMNALVRKGYVNRVRSEKDKRVVLISLTEKGVLAYQRHEAFHRKIIEAIQSSLNEEQCKILIEALTSLARGFSQI